MHPFHQNEPSNARFQCRSTFTRLKLLLSEIWLQILEFLALGVRFLLLSITLQWFIWATELTVLLLAEAVYWWRCSTERQRVYNRTRNRKNAYGWDFLLDQGWILSCNFLLDFQVISSVLHRAEISCPETGVATSVHCFCSGPYAVLHSSQVTSHSTSFRPFRSYFFSWWWDWTWISARLKSHSWLQEHPPLLHLTSIVMRWPSFPQPQEFISTNTKVLSK